MKRKLMAYGFLILSLAGWPGLVCTQDHAGIMPVEKLHVMTDRTLYIAGEKILFSASITKDDDHSCQECSKVLYTELVKPDGNPVAGGKYAVENSSARGCLQIPEEALTGYYYLKSYTRWMRNGSQEEYSFIRLKIINPYTAELLGGKDTIADLPDLPQKKDLKVFAAKSEYLPGEEVVLKIEGDKTQNFAGKLCLSVVPVMASQYAEINPGKGNPISADSIRYYPETRGISISGRLLEQGTGKPVANALVNLSIIGDYDVMAIRTNGSGLFYFALPGYAGSRDIFLCGEEIAGRPVEVFIDNDFCPRPVNLPSPAFDLTEQEDEIALKMAMNQKVSSIYYKDTTVQKAVISGNTLPFYGEPDEILAMDKYIDLPTVEDYFSELLGSVNVRKFEGGKIFRFNSARAEMTIYDPLVLVDWVAVNDIEKVLAMSPRLISRIELVNSPYVKGNITYGGIISFVSKNEDFAGIDLPSSGTFVNYKFLEPCSPLIPQGPMPSNMPDPRNTVYWDPDLVLDAAGKAEVRFTTPDTPGKYEIIVSELNASGVSPCNVLKFEVLKD